MTELHDGIGTTLKKIMYSTKQTSKGQISSVIRNSHWCTPKTSMILDRNNLSGERHILHQEKRILSRYASRAIILQHHTKILPVMAPKASYNLENRCL